MLYKVDHGADSQNGVFVECDLQLTMNESDRQLQYHYNKHMNIVISNIDGANAYDRALVKVVRIYCRKWSCDSSIFQKIQVSFYGIISIESRQILKFVFSSDRLSLRISYWMHSLIYLSQYVLY